MRTSPSRRWRCLHCGHITRVDDLLTAPNPFDPEELITGCPKCKGIDFVPAWNGTGAPWAVTNERGRS